MDREEIIRWLRETDAGALNELWRRADDARRRNVGDEVHLRGLVEFSNRCSRGCLYCGLRADNAALPRYRLTADEIVACAGRAVELGYGTLVLQSGEDAALDASWLADVVRRVKAAGPLAVTLSVGEWGRDELALWRQAGADRYLLRFETADERLFRRIHPPRAGQTLSRFDILRILRDLDYQVGSGMLIGVPGQTYDDLARGVELFAEFDLDMIGSGPFIPHPATPLGEGSAGADAAQTPNTDEMTYKLVSLSRLVCPLANIPATTALATLNRRAGYETALARGANVIMPNLTPPQYRKLYEIYPGKVSVNQDDTYHYEIRRRIEAVGRRVGTGRGDSPRWLAACTART